ncbi:hypothetical protein EV426DRAFT_625342 [Tirmania nivea]|nr:hypothetical protein EV426DRAFT_625342 [Tirmania nivea]
MIYHDVLATFLALYVVTTVAYIPPYLGQKIDQLEQLPVIKAYAEPVYQKRDFSLKRQDSIGSWSLRAVTCPENTKDCESGFTAMSACCPKSAVCSISLYQVACCATDSKCHETADTFPKCGDSSWSLWAGGRDAYFCCQPGEIGYVTTDKSGACGPDTLKPTGSQVATLAAQGEGGEQPPQTSTPGNDGSNTGNSPTDNSQTGNSQNPNPNGSTSSTSSPRSSGLPTGAIAGIAIGGVVILILAGVAIFFALKAGKSKGHAEAMAAFQEQQRNLPGNNTYQSGGSTPGAVVPPMSPPPPQPHTQWKSDNSSVVAEKYGEAQQRSPNAPPPQWSAPINNNDGPSYEADATNIYSSQNHAEMDGYHNQRGY